MWGQPDPQWLPMVGGPKDGELLYWDVGAMDRVVVPLPCPPEDMFRKYEPGEMPSALRMAYTTYSVQKVATPDYWVQYVLVHESIGWDRMRRWGAPEVIPLIMRAWRARWAQTLCKHCGERVVAPSRPREYIHATGPQAGLHRCAVEPYGYNAEAVGMPCSGHPNRCAGHDGSKPRAVHSA